MSDSHSRQTDHILNAERERLLQRRRKTPPAAVVRLAEMQAPPHPLLNTVPLPGYISLLGEVAYTDPYDPVGMALRLARAGVEGITFFTDQQVYAHGLDDLLLVCRGVKRPVFYQNYVLDEYHVAETRAAGAAVITLYASVLSDAMLRKTVSIAQRWRMSTAVQVENAAQLEVALSLSPHVICVGSPDVYDIGRDMAMLADLRPHVPRHSKVMLLGCVHNAHEAQTALSYGVSALTLHHTLLDAPDELNLIRQLVNEGA